ncbi:PucR family transcriptional regulator [Ihubacter sp. mB4P-1]|uniref:PucR family transcriptional regulator ligand-binding domain-containing protein n=1 Tax=Ihubacter sp. mB4P-1 TaxID=3242370 RepID=UPI00137ADA96
MKDITVLDILHLPIMANAELKAGQNGLSNIVSYVNVLDNYYDETDAESTPINYGQNFYLTSMSYGVGNEEYVNILIRHFIDLKVSAVCIIDEYLNELPSTAYALADEYQLPIIFIDSNTPYALIISSIMELKLSYQESELHENLVHELVSAQCKEERKSEIISMLNKNFHTYVRAFYCVNTDLSSNKITAISNEVYLLNKIRENKFALGCHYKKGMLIIWSYRTVTNISSCEDEIQFIRRMLPNAVIGISELLPLKKLDEVIVQASTAGLSGAHDINGTVHFRDIGLSKLLVRLISNPLLEDYFDELYTPIVAHDERYHSDLLETMSTFIECDLDHVKTGKRLHIHVNTVRYRLNKIRELIPYGRSSLDFNQTLYFIYKIMKLKAFV